MIKTSACMCEMIFKHVFKRFKWSKLIKFKTELQGAQKLKSFRSLTSWFVLSDGQLQQLSLQPSGPRSPQCPRASWWQPWRSWDGTYPDSLPLQASGMPGKGGSRGDWVRPQWHILSYQSRRYQKAAEQQSKGCYCCWEPGHITYHCLARPSPWTSIWGASLYGPLWIWVCVYHLHSVLTATAM